MTKLSKHCPFKKKLSIVHCTVLCDNVPLKQNVGIYLLWESHVTVSLLHKYQSLTKLKFLLGKLSNQTKPKTGSTRVFCQPLRRHFAELPIKISRAVTCTPRTVTQSTIGSVKGDANLIVKCQFLLLTCRTYNTRRFQMYSVKCLF